MAITWKVAAAGGAALGLGIGGFALNSQDDTSFQQIRDVDLQSARDSISSLSSPIKVTTTTVKEASASPVTPAPAPAPAPTVDSAQSAASPVTPAPAPAPAPVYEDSVSPVQPAPSGTDDSASAASVGGDST